MVVMLSIEYRLKSHNMRTSEMINRAFTDTFSQTAYQFLPLRLYISVPMGSGLIP